MKIALVPTWLQEFEKEARYMPKQEEVHGVWHERPYFNGHGHYAQWVQTWVSDSTDDLTVPVGSPIVCAICGRAYGN